jgi:hypothetical protein
MRAQYTEQLLSRAERDPEFRKQLTEDPSSAIEEELGVEVPESIQVRVLEEGPNEAVLALPRYLGPGQLSDEQLAAVAGVGCDTYGNTDAGTTCTY